MLRMRQTSKLTDSRIDELFEFFWGKLASVYNGLRIIEVAWIIVGHRPVRTPDTNIDEEACNEEKKALDC